MSKEEGSIETFHRNMLLWRDDSFCVVLDRKVRSSLNENGPVQKASKGLMGATVTEIP